MDNFDGMDHDFAKPLPPSRIIRMPSLKRGRDDVAIDDRVKLERVLGLTVGSNAALDCDPSSELVAYPAGCTIVLFNTKKSKQHHIVNASRKTITCLTFSPDGKYLATGECGHAPSLRVWSMADCTQVAEFQGHKYGINCVAFSPNGRNLVSVGSQHDMIVNVWDWRANVKVASNKVSTRVKAVSFAESGKYFVTVGVRHVKFWYLDTKSHKNIQPVPLVGRSAILGEQRDNYFCDVACGKGANSESTYAITKSGLLCEFNVRRLLDQWVELRTRSANCMTVGDDLIFVGCADGIVRCFSQSNLQFLVTLPRTHYLGVDVSLGLDIRHLLTHPTDAKYPDAIAVAYDQVSKKITCVYNDHSLYVWDVNNIHRVGKSHSFLYHSACIWGVEMYPDVGGLASGVPPGSFITCSSDDTIRIWNLNQTQTNNENVPQVKRNIYSKDLLKVLYVDKELTHLKDVDLTNSTGEKPDGSGYDGKNGVRCVRISPDGRHLASGDREGNIRVHDIQSLRQTVMIEAHDAEVLSLEYTTGCSEKLLASASRDRLIHVFDVEKGYNCVQTLDDHSSSITAVRFLNHHGQLQMVSCSADKSIIFRPYLPINPGGVKQFLRDHNVAGKTTLYDMEVDATQKHVLTACQDRNIRVYNVGTGKHSKTFKGSLGEDGTLIKVSLDRSGIYIATSCTDKSLSIYDYYSSECMATMLGHSELVTGLRFTNDCKRLISASGDGCIFVWKLPRDMVVTMQARIQQQAVRSGREGLGLRSLRDQEQSDSEMISDVDLLHTESDDPSPSIDGNANVDNNGFRFGLGKLPAWARREVEDPTKSGKIMEMTDSPDHPVHTGYRVVKVNKPPQGRWAQRIENNEIKIATFSPEKLPERESPSSLESHEEGKTKEEGAEFDGDAEDSDVEMETHYYPATTETKSDFTVNANDLEELRRSVRKYPRPGTLPGVTLSSASGGDSDLEDVSSEADTPSTDLSLAKLSASTDGLHLLAQRETYLQTQMEFAPEDRKDSTGKSITSQYLVRNTSAINAVIQTKSEIEKMNKREELRRRLEDTRRTLQSSGLSSSPLRASQSTIDLSRYQDPRSPATRHAPPAHSGNPAHPPPPPINLLSLFNPPITLKKPASLSLLPSHTSLPESPTSEQPGDMQRSCSFYVDLKAAKKEKAVREKELLLLAHDRLGMEFHTRSIEDLLDEFSSDSLESESSRRCVSDFPLGRQRHDSDTDYSGLNSLQGSGDLLEMLEEEESLPEKHSSRDERKGDAFYVEIDASPRRHKPILRAKSLPGKNQKPMVPTKPPKPPKPEMKKIAQTKSRLLLKCNLTLLPSKTAQENEPDDEEGLRRAISLSDLSNSSEGPVKSGSPKNVYNNGSNARSLQTNISSMQRCRSVGVLNRTDSETDLRENRGNSGGLMRPTISSQNKVNSSSTTNGNKMAPPARPINTGLKRRTAAQSSVNLSTVGINDDSSSEEVSMSKGKLPADRNNQTRRPSNLGRYSSMKDLSSKAQEVTARLTRPRVQGPPDVSSAPLSKQLCSSVSTQASLNVDNLIVLHKRLTLEAGRTTDRAELQQMAEDIEKSAIEIQQRLQTLTSKLKNNNSVIRNQLSSTNVNPANFLGNNLGFPATTPYLTNANANPNLMSNIDMNRFSEMFVTMVHQITENQQNNQKK